jgi:hypothetical protein
MPEFRLYRHPLHGISAIYEGFSWPAFFLGPIWLIIYRLWIQLFVWTMALSVAIAVTVLFMEAMFFQIFILNEYWFRDYI